MIYQMELKTIRPQGAGVKAQHSQVWGTELTCEGRAEAPCWGQTSFSAPISTETPRATFQQPVHKVDTPPPGFLMAVHFSAFFIGLHSFCERWRITYIFGEVSEDMSAIQWQVLGIQGQPKARQYTWSNCKATTSQFYILYHFWHCVVIMLYDNIMLFLKQNNAYFTWRWLVNVN